MKDMNAELQYSWPDYDPDNQLRAIRDIISNLGDLLEKRRKEIESTDYTEIDRRNPLGDFYASDLQEYFFLSTAASHAAITLIAPFLEGLFRHELNSYRINLNGVRVRHDHSRYQLEDEKFWNIKYWIDDKEKLKQGISHGIYQILEALHILEHFPDGCREMLEMIFSYRNYTLHHGLEAIKDASKGSRYYYNEITKQGWGEHFDWSYSDNKPWMLSMKIEAIGKCFMFCVAVKESFEKMKGIHEYI